MLRIKLFAFDTSELSSELLPLAARRALDHAGLRLSRVSWGSLSDAARQALCAWGADPEVAVEAVRREALAASPAPDSIAIVGDPPANEPSEAIRQAFQASGPLSAAVWSALTPLERYALAKVASRSEPERRRAAYAEIVGFSAVSTHLAAAGGVRMVDVGSKVESRRRAVASNRVRMSPSAFAALRAQQVPKGDVLGTARLAAIMAAKRTADWIPLCHPLPLTHIAVELELDAAEPVLHIQVTVETVGKTGVEMEALVAASCAALTVYDMLKGIDRGMEMGPCQLLAKSGGASGDFER
jgi:cyclic pyranopterin monophosphate synthase